MLAGTVSMRHDTGSGRGTSANPDVLLLPPALGVSGRPRPFSAATSSTSRKPTVDRPETPSKRAPSMSTNSMSIAPDFSMQPGLASSATVDAVGNVPPDLQAFDRGSAELIQFLWSHFQNHSSIVKRELGDMQKIVATLQQDAVARDERERIMKGEFQDTKEFLQTSDGDWKTAATGLANEFREHASDQRSEVYESMCDLDAQLRQALQMLGESQEQNRAHCTQLQASSDQLCATHKELQKEVSDLWSDSESRSVQHREVLQQSLSEVDRTIRSDMDTMSNEHHTIHREHRTNFETYLSNCETRLRQHVMQISSEERTKNEEARESIKGLIGKLDTKLGTKILCESDRQCEDSRVLRGELMECQREIQALQTTFSQLKGNVRGIATDHHRDCLTLRSQLNSLGEETKERHMVTIDVKKRVNNISSIPLVQGALRKT